MRPAIALRIGPLAALWHDVAVVIPSNAALHDRGEGQAAAQAADQMADMLAGIGLGSDAVDEQSVARGALKGRRAAVLAYNPAVADNTTAALERFVASGGKLLACYQLPPRLQAALGFGKLHYVRPERPGQFAEIRFDAPDVPGLPPAVRQASWNITAAEPVGFHARVIGQWYDSAGHAAGQPAMLLGDRGAFFSHIFLPDDAAGKRQLLAAVLGKLVPELWADMAHGEQERAGRVGYLPAAEAVAALVRASGNAAAVARLGNAARGPSVRPATVWPATSSPPP